MNDIQVVTKYMDRPGPTDLKQIFKELGILYAEKDITASAVIVCNDDESFEIIVDRKLSLQRRRFAAAHQLAHFILHRDVLVKAKPCVHADLLWGDVPADPSPLSDAYDRQANRLAIQILMPITKVNRLMKEGFDKPAMLTKHFGVSEKVIQLRLESLV